PPCGSTPAVPVMRRAHPLSSSCRDETFHIERRVPPEHVVDRTAELGGQHTESLALPVLLLQALEVLLPLRVAPQKQRRGFGEGPLQVDVADLLALPGLLLAGRLMGAFDQAGVGEEIANPRETGDVVDLVEQGQREDL